MDAVTFALANACKANPTTISNVSNMPTARYNVAAKVIGNKLYVVGGSTSGGAGATLSVVEVYDFITGTWSTVANYPVVMASMAGDVINGVLYLTSGDFYPSGYTSTQYSNATYCYNPTTNTWTSLASFGNARHGTVAVAYNGFLYTFGGAQGSTQYTGNYKYDPVSNTVVSVASYSSGYFYGGATTLNGNIYMVTCSSQNFGDCLKYDPIANTVAVYFNVNSYANVIASGGNAVGFDTDKIYCYCGTFYGNAVDHNLAIFDLTNKVAYCETLHGTYKYTPSAATAMYNDDLYLVGGYNSSGTPSYGFSNLQKVKKPFVSGLDVLKAWIAAN